MNYNEVKSCRMARHALEQLDISDRIHFLTNYWLEMYNKLSFLDKKTVRRQLQNGLRAKL